MASVQTIGENCIVNMANRVNRRGMQVGVYGAKKQLTLRGGGCIFNSEWARTFPEIRASNQSAAKAYCVACNTHFGIGHGGRHDVKRHIERAAHIAKAQSPLGSINRFVAAGCEIDKVTSAEIAFTIFIAMHNLPMAVGDEFGLLAKKMWCTTVPVAPPGGGKILTTAFSSGVACFFVR